MSSTGLLLVGEMDEIQTVFYLLLLITLMVGTALILAVTGLIRLVPLVREGEHPLIAGLLGLVFLGLLAFLVIAGIAVADAAIVNRPA